jgi:hypothetical protein
LSLRSELIEELATSNVLCVENSHLSLFFPSSISVGEQNIQLKPLKVEGLEILFSLCDKHTGHAPKIPVQDDDESPMLTPEQRSRFEKEIYLGSLPPRKLALALIVLHLAGAGWSGRDDIELEDGDMINHTEEEREGTRREVECAFRERLLVHGGIFLARATRPTSEAELLWVSRALDAGLSELRQYESGQLNSGSLQSVLFKVFCSKLSCPIRHGWDAIWDVIIDELDNNGYSIISSSTG